ncbi:MAG: hypothetical protein LC789_06915 [Actinobacteria bacterium]|nr:hypothetical protein [Actinomycetota bacterium]
MAARIGDEHRRGIALLGRAERVETGLGVVDHLPALGEAARAARVAGDLPLLVRLLARRATLRAAHADLRGPVDEAQEAVELARPLGDPRLLAVALNAVHVCCWGPGGEERAARVSAELVGVAAASGDGDLILEAEVARMVDALRTGDLIAYDDALARATAVADRTRSPRHRYFVLTRRATRLLVAGRLAEAGQLVRRAYEIGLSIEEPDALQVSWGAQFLVLAELNPAEDLLEMAEVLAQYRTAEPRVAVVEANLRAAAGELPEAARLLAAHLDEFDAADTLAASDLSWGVLMALTAVATEDPPLAARVEAALTPYRGRLVVNAGAVTFCGAVEHWLGLLAQVQGRQDEARALLADALARYRRMGATWFVREVEQALARAAPPAVAGGLREALLREVDGGWEAGWSGTARRLPDARGLHHLHALVSAAGREVHAVDLVTPGASALVTSHARQALLDGTAKVAYRRRISELQAQVAEAEEDGDVETAAQAASELETLLGELRRAVGLGGRDRHAPDDAERARVAVRKAVTAALTRLAEHDPSFAAHLRASVRTGSRCAYEPDPAVQVRWLLR